MNPRYEGASPAATYNGFSGASAQPAEGRRSPYLSRNAILGGVAMAVVGGLAIGAMARPEIARSTPRPMSPVSSAALEGGAQPLPVVMAAPPAPAAVPRPASGDKLEVLPAEMAAAAPVGYRPARPGPAPRLDVAPAVSGYDAADEAPVRMIEPRTMRRQPPPYAEDRYASDRYAESRFRDDRYAPYREDRRADPYADDEDDGPYGDPRD